MNDAATSSPRIRPLTRWTPVAALAPCALGIVTFAMVGDLMGALMLLMAGGLIGLAGAVLNVQALRKGQDGARRGLVLSMVAIFAFPLFLATLYALFTIRGFT